MHGDEALRVLGCPGARTARASVRPTSGAPISALTPVELLKRADDVSLSVAVECAAVARASGRNSGAPNVSTPALTMKLWRPDDISNDRQPACARPETSAWRRQAGVGDHRGAAHRQPLVARMRGVQQRRADGVVMAQDRGDAVVDRRAHAVEAGEAAVLMAEEAQRRQHPLDRADQRRRRLLGLVGIGLAKRQQVGQQFQNRHRVARDVAAVRQDLPLDLVGKVAGGGAQRRRRDRQRQRREGQRDAGAQLLLAVRHLWRHRAEEADLHRQRPQEGAVERELGALQHDRRMLQPGDDALAR